MSSGKISRRKLIALEKDLSLAVTGGLDDVNVTEKAIEALLREARRLISTTDDRDVSFGHLLENLLLVDPDPKLLSALGRESEADYSKRWTGSLLSFEGDVEIFIDLYIAASQLRAIEGSQSLSRSGTKGGSSDRDTNVKDDVVAWWNKDGWKMRVNKSAAIEWLIANWSSFCSEYGVTSREVAPHRKTIYKYLQGLQHQSDKKQSR